MRLGRERWGPELPCCTAGGRMFVCLVAGTGSLLTPCPHGKATHSPASPKVPRRVCWARPVCLCGSVMVPAELPSPPPPRHHQLSASEVSAHCPLPAVPSTAVSVGMSCLTVQSVTASPAVASDPSVQMGGTGEKGGGSRWHMGDSESDMGEQLGNPSIAPVRAGLPPGRHTASYGCGRGLWPV